MHCPVSMSFIDSALRPGFLSITMRVPFAGGCFSLELYQELAVIM